MGAVQLQVHLLHVGPGDDGFAKVLVVLLDPELEPGRAGLVHRAQPPSDEGDALLGDGPQAPGGDHPVAPHGGVGLQGLRQEPLHGGEHGRQEGRRLVDPFPQDLLFFQVEGEGDPAGDRGHRVGAASPHHLVDLLPDGAQPERHPGQLGVGLHDADDVAPGGVGVNPQSQVGTLQHEDGEAVRVDDVPQVHEFPQQQGGRGRGDPRGPVQRVAGGDVVRGRADPADARRDVRQAVGLHADQYLLEAAQLVHHQPGVFQRSGIVQVDEDLGVPLDPGHRVDLDGFFHCSTSA